jgi:putative tryptophan/tyrosine transport system substrate-binding protein
LKRREILAAATIVGLPLPLSAQPKAVPVIGFLSNGNEKRGTFPTIFPEFRRGLGEAGYVEGKNLAIEFRFSDGSYDRLPALAADLVARKVDLIATTGGNSVALAAKGASQTIPIVFETGDDPVEAGLVATLARPGGNATGVANLFNDLAPKLLDLLGEIVPPATGFGLLVNLSNRDVERIIRDAEEAAASKRVKLTVLKVATPSELDPTFASLSQREVGAVVIVADVLFVLERQRLARLATQLQYRRSTPSAQGSLPVAS